MTLSSCLVTSTPSFEERKRTAPFLLSETADPDLREIMVIDVTEPVVVDFSVGVVSEDADTKVHGQLVLDYGVGVQGYDTPYVSDIGRPVTLDEPGTLDDPPRTLSARWSLNKSNHPPLGCHNVALFASHEFDDATGCSVDPVDFDYVLWTIILCDSAQEGTCCKPTADPDKGGCTLKCPLIDPEVRCGQSAGASP